MPKQTALDTINRLIAEENSSGATRQRTGDAVRTIDQLLAEEEEKERQQEEERQRRQQATRNAASVDETMDLVRSYGDYGLERRAAETPQPVKEERRGTSNALTPEMEARYQQANGVNRAPTAYQTYMMQVANSQPKQEETRSTEELRRDMNRQNRLAKATTRMAADMGNRMTQDQSLIYNPAYTSNLRTIEQTMTAQQEKADRATNLYQTLSVQRREQEEREKYAALMSNPDFAAKSQADASIGNKTSATSLAPAERLYQKIFHRNDTKDINGNIKDAAGSDAARFVNDEEAAIFYYLWNTQGAKAAQSYYYGYVENRAGERRAQLAQQQAQAYGEYDPVGASIARVGYNAMSGIGLVDMAFQNLTRALGITDRNKPLNYNSDAQLPGQVADALQSGASSFIEQFAADEIKRINPNVKHPENYAKVASFLYQTGMSMADSSVAIALNLMGIPEPLTLANMGAAAGTRAIREARERGATDGQALAFGFSSAIMEALFEKISLDRILEPSYAKTAKEHFLNALKQSFTEGSEEVMTTLANTAADMFIMGDKAELYAIQRQLMEQGVSEKEALSAAFKQWGTGIVGDLLGGMISGFGMGGVKEVGTGLGIFAQGVRQDMQTARALTDYQNAQQAAPQVMPQQTPAAPVQQRQLTAREQNPLRFAMNKAQNGETVTGNDAKAILNDPQAVQTLRDAGVLADTIRPGAEGRAQIQQAVQALAEQNRAVTAELQQETERNSQLPVRNQQETAQERTVPPLPRQMAQEQQERVTTPPVPQNTQEAAQEPTLRLRAQEEQAPRQETLRIRDSEVAEPTRQAPLTIRDANATVEENRQEESYGQGQQTETAAAAGEDDFRARAETAAEGARRSYLDRIERSSGLGRVLQDLRNYRIVRGAESRASEVARIRNQAEAGNQRDVSALDYGVSNGSAEQSAKELDNATASRVLGRNWDRAVAELARQGWTLKGMTGQLWKQDGPPVRAFINGDTKTIVVQVDHTKLSWDQLLAHEDLHRRIQENKDYRKAVEDALLADKNLRAYLPEIIDRYAQAYAKHAPDLTSDDVIEELLADYRAGFDMLDPLGMNPITARAAKRAAKDIKSAEKTLRKQVEEQRPVSVDDEAKASREFDSDYMQAAVAYNQTSKHVPDSLMNDVAKVRETIKAKLEEIQDEARLPADVTGNTYFGNGSYNGSEENTTVCPRSLSVDALADAVGDALGRPLTIEETVYVAQQAFHFTDVPQCLYCYVAMDRMAKRQLLGEYVNKRTQVLTDIQNGMSREEALAAYKKRETSGGKQWSKNKQARFERWVNDYESGKPTLKMSDLSSEAQVEKTLANPDLRAEAQDALQYAQNASWAKKRVSFTAYNNHILKWDQKRINALNSMFGLRMYSFSDFSPAFILENMQMVTDAAVRGLKMLAYTKELDFVRIFAGTGMNINISTFGMDGGDGNVHMDAMQGADWKEAQELRKKYPNVGVTFVATNDNQVNWALDQDWIDVVIPFHMVKTGATVADILGYQNYTGESSDKKIAGEKAKQKEIFPSQHQNNKEKYLAALEKARLTPRFERWLDHPNYMKLVNETRRSAGDTPAVQPKFDQEAVNAALKSLDDMVKRGGYGVPIGGSLENLADIAEEMSDDIRKGIAQDLREHNRQKGKASTEIDADYLAAVNSGDMETAQRMADEAAKEAGAYLDRNGHPLLIFHGTDAKFNSFDIEKGGYGTFGIGHYFSIYPSDAEMYGDNQVEAYLMSKRVATQDTHNITSAQIEEFRSRYGLKTGAGALDDWVKNSDDAHILLDAMGWASRKDENTNTQILKDIREVFGVDATRWDRGYITVFDNRLVKRADPVTYDDNGNIIHLSQRFNPENNDIRYSTEIDTDYMNAVESGDMETAQKMVDEAAKAAGYTTKGYHGTSAKFNVFSKKKQGDNWGGDSRLGPGFYFAHDRKTADKWSDGTRIIEAWLSIKKPLDLRKAAPSDIVEQIKKRTENKLQEYDSSYPISRETYESNLKRMEEILLKDPALFIDEFKYDSNGKMTDGIREFLSGLGYDGIISNDEIVVFEPEQIKSADPVTYDDNGNIIPLSKRFNPENNDIRYSLEMVDPIQPVRQWQRGATYDEVKAAHPTLFELAADEAETRNPTQINGTVKTYRKIYDMLKQEDFDGTILDASSGLGYGTRVGRDEYGYDVDDIEPFPDKSYSPKYTDYSKMKKTYDVVISNAVLNVIPQDLRDAMVVKIGEMLNPGGRAFINVRGTDVKNAKSKVPINEDQMEYFIADSGSYQKGFRKVELVNYLKDALGDGFTVAPNSSFGGVSAVVTKNGGSASIEIDPEVAAQFSPEAIARRQSNRTKGVKGERKVSRVRSNTYEYSGLYNEVEAQMDGADEENYTYDPVSEKKSMNEALGRLKADFDGEVSRLSEADRQWGGSDLDTAMGILHRYRTEGRATGDYGDFWRWSKVIQEKGTKGGQFIQAFAKYTRTGTGAAMKGAKDIHDRFKLNPAQQKQVDAAKKKLMDGIEKEYDGAASDAMKQAKGQKEPGKKQDGKVDKKKLDAEVQRRKDAERLVREISKLFEKQQNHGEPVENWLNLTGEELARKIAGRFSEPKQRTKTTMQTILSDLVGFAEEHALPERRNAEGEKRTAIDTITDYLNNRDAYGTAWAAAQSYLRAAYTDDQEKLDALNSFLTATIAYNAEGTDRTMLDAILQSADVLGISEKRILELTSAGATTSTIDRIGDELVSQVKERMGADYDESFTQQLKDAVRRHITGIALQESAEEQRLRLGGMTTDAARQLEINLQKLLTQSRGDKNRAAQSVADYLIRELGIPSSDAAIAADRITGAFMDELASRADRRLQQMFAEKKPRTQEQRDRLLDLIRLGGLTNSNVEDAVVDALGIGGMSRERQRKLVADMARFGETLDAMEDDDAEGLRQLIREQAAARGTRLSRLSEKTLSGETDIEYLRDFALAQLASIAGDFENRSAGEMISTYQTISHLLNMRTALRNVTSNQVFDLIDSAANNVSMLPDMVLGLMTGKRTVGLNKSWASQQKRQGAVQGARRNALEVNLDVGVDDRQKSKYGTAGRRTWAMASSRTAGKILSHLEEVMGYELNTTDEFHKGSVMGETLDSLSRFVDRGDMTLEEAQEFATEMALYRSFQDDSLIGTMLSSIKDALNLAGVGEQNGKQLKSKKVHDFGLGDFVTKYTQVPGALVHRAIEFSPLGYAKALFNLGQLANARRQGYETNAAQRKAALAIGRATTGTGLITLFAALAKAGLLRRDEDEDKNAKAAHQAQGLNGTQLNLTALGRKIEGGSAEPEDGDILIDINFLEPLDALMGLATLVANEDERNLESIWNDSITAVWDSISSLSMMQTLRDAYNVYQYYDDKDEDKMPLMNQMLLEIASSSLSGFIPSPVRQLAQATDTTYRDQYRSKKISDQMRDKAKNSIPGLRQTLAPKITPLGEDKKYEKPLLNYLNATLNPGNISVYKSNKIVSELERVYDETENANIWPERNAPYSFKAGDEKYTLTPDERTQYQRTRGQETAKFIEAVMGANWYKAMSPDSQAKILNDVGNFANYIAKKEMLDARGVDYVSDDYQKLLDMYLGGATPADVMKEANKKLAGLMDAGLTEDQAKEAKGLKTDEFREYIKNQDLSDEDKLSAMAAVLGTEMTTPTGKPTQWAQLNNAVNGGLSVDRAIELVQSNLLDDYTKYADAGLTSKTSDTIVTAISKLKPENGYDDVRDVQKWNAIINTVSDNASQEKALKAVMKDSQWASFQEVKSADVSAATYVKFKYDTRDYSSTRDETTGKEIKGQTKKDKMMSYIDGLNIPDAQKDALYLVDYAESGLKDTPWHKGGGKGSGSYAMARTPALRLPDAPRAEKPGSGLRIRDTQPSETRQSSGLRLPATNAAPRQSSGLRLK